MSIIAAAAVAIACNVAREFPLVVVHDRHCSGCSVTVDVTTGLMETSSGILAKTFDAIPVPVHVRGQRLPDYGFHFHGMEDPEKEAFRKAVLALPASGADLVQSLQKKFMDKSIVVRCERTQTVVFWDFQHGMATAAFSASPAAAVCCTRCEEAIRVSPSSFPKERRRGREAKRFCTLLCEQGSHSHDLFL